MRLVLELHDSDGYTYHCKNSYPVEYESAETLLAHLMDEALAALREDRLMDRIAGLQLQSAFFYDLATLADAMPVDDNPKYVAVNKEIYFMVPPDIFTVDEWFAAQAAESESRA